MYLFIQQILLSAYFVSVSGLGSGVPRGAQTEPLLSWSSSSKGHSDINQTVPLMYNYELSFIYPPTKKHTILERVNRNLTQMRETGRASLRKRHIKDQHWLDLYLRFKIFS